MILRPQKGPQEKFLATKADIAIYGGAAGGGKTYALLLEPLRYMNVDGYSATIFRKNATQINIDGGLLDESMSIYGFLKNALYKASPKPHWVFGGKSKVSFMHIDGDRDLPKWQGSQICCDLDTLVLMADESYKKVSDLKVGDKVLTLEGINEISFAGDPILKECVEVELPNGQRQIQTVDHKVLTRYGWLSYEDLIFSRPTSTCNNQESCEHRRSSRSIHQTFAAWIQNHQERIEQFFELFQDLRRSALEPCACRMLHEILRLLISAPNQDRDVYKFARTCERIRLLIVRFLGSQSVHLRQEAESFSLIRDRQCLPENAEHTALSAPENDCAEFQRTHRVDELHILCRLLQEVWQLLQESARCGFSSDAVLDVVPDEKRVSSVADCSGSCPAYSRFDDEQLHSTGDSDRVCVLTLNDVVVRNQKDLRFYVRGKAPKYSRHILRYVHPYTGEERQTEVDYSYQTLKLTPCKKRFVRNICVVSSNHYITKSGLVNKNCYAGFDELTHFTANQFFYMLSRNRSTCGVKPYVRATCNPDVDSWVADFVSWWIDPVSGYPIPERSGVLRYFCRVDGEIKWGDSAEELAEKFNVDPELCKSVTFIASSVYDNKILLENDPSYLANLHGLSLVERERLLNGNWKIRPAAGLYFKSEQARIVKTVPEELVSVVRAWDLAATEINLLNKDPDRTAGVLMGRMKNGQYIVLDVKRTASNAANVRAIVKSTAATDKAEYNCRKILIPQDPGQAGKEQAQSYLRELAGYSVKSRPVTGDKVTRAEPFAAQWQQGNVLLLEGNWNDTFLDELEGFPDALHDDQVDAASDAFSAVAYARTKSISRSAFGF